MGPARHDYVRQRKILLGVLAVVSVAFIYGILFGSQGLRRFLALRSTLDSRSVEAYGAIVRNRALHENLIGLRSDERVLEEAARARLGVAGEDEIVYVFGRRSRRHTP